MMRGFSVIICACVFSTSALAKDAKQRADISPPQTVRVESVRVEAGAKLLIVGNAAGKYALSCNLKAAGCMTPLPGNDYYLFDSNTRWRMPGASEDIDLKFIQDWTVTYNSTENIGLIPKQGGGPGTLGLYMLDSWTTAK
ncbi:MAG TPA: hypothetical protein VLC29_06275 [Rhizomicrobium sp.]|nr:hypothetical protein [Rhizomicrobium sp.]